MTVPTIELKAVHHLYGDRPSVCGLDLQVHPGEVVCLLGPSGCGKTTALRIAAGLEDVQAGSVELDGAVVSTATMTVPPEKREIGLVFQDYALFPHMTIAANIAFGLHDRATAKARVAEVLEQVGLTEYADAYPHELSGGQQQRVALARALAPKPKAVLMDEPFSGLDARLREAVRDRTLHILKSTGAAVLMVTHDAEEAMHMADRIVVMRAGKVQQEGPPDELYLHPNSGFVAAFFGDVNRIDVTVSGGVAETPIGTFTCKGISDGRTVELVIRPEALTLVPAEEGRKAQVKVLASRMLGRTSLLHLCTCIGSETELHLHARVPGRFLPEAGSVFSVDLDRSQVFVFPVGEAT